MCNGRKRGLVITDDTKIQNLIYNARGKQIMLDSDLAMLYQVETKNLNKAMKRNIKRFPEDFCFRLTESEYENLRFQNGTSSLDDNHGGRQYMPYVFTEQGIAMLSAVLRSNVAIAVSIKIMQTFVEMRKYLANNSLLIDKVNHLETKQIESDLQRQAYEQRTDERFEQVSVLAYTCPSARITNQDITNINAQYLTLEVRRSAAFHDRFLILDEKEGYHIGALIKVQERSVLQSIGWKTWV